MEGKDIIASGPVIIEDGKLLVDKDDKDDFYKIPGGRIEGIESLEETCCRETKEEINAEIEIIKPLISWQHQHYKFFFTLGLFNPHYNCFRSQSSISFTFSSNITWSSLADLPWS